MGEYIIRNKDVSGRLGLPSSAAVDLSLSSTRQAHIHFWEAA